MQRQQIEDFSVGKLREAFEHYDSGEAAPPYVSSDLSVVLQGQPRILFGSFLQREVPYRVEQARLVLVRQGTADISLNLQDYHIEAGTALFAADGCVLQINRISDDAELMGLAFGEELLSSLYAAGRPDLLRRPRTACLFPVSAEDRTLIESQYSLLYHLALRGAPFREPAKCIVASMLSLYSQLHARYAADHQPQERRLSREHAVCDRFIQLITQHCTRERSLAFYADALCLTPRYLGTIVHNVSGRTAKEWIDRAVLTEAKLQLRHTDRSVAQVSDALGFPNPSFFSKFFKRLTQTTPAEFRAGKS
ncbi:MAG: AraC family transcriptional regulator [Alloprevotella sp.]|nr:AraC family transcriptional regulator [Alloprevotella sp.]